MLSEAHSVDLVSVDRLQDADRTQCKGNPLFAFAIPAIEVPMPSCCSRSMWARAAAC
jgi:hypothetical protein